MAIDRFNVLRNADIVRDTWTLFKQTIKLKEMTRYSQILAELSKSTLLTLIDLPISIAINAVEMAVLLTDAQTRKTEFAHWLRAVALKSTMVALGVTAGVLTVLAMSTPAVSVVLGLTVVASFFKGNFLYNHDKHLGKANTKTRLYMIADLTIGILGGAALGVGFFVPGLGQAMLGVAIGLTAMHLIGVLTKPRPTHKEDGEQAQAAITDKDPTALFKLSKGVPAITHGASLLSSRKELPQHPRVQPTAIPGLHAL